MYRDYHFVNRCVIELNEILHDARITDIYSQEKNKLFVTIPSEDQPFRHLIISTNPQFQYLLIKDEHHKAKKNTVKFFNEIYGESISKIEIAVDDRIVKLSLLDSELFFILRGGQTNVILSNKGKPYKFFKKNIISESDLDLLSEYVYSSSMNLSDINSAKLKITDYKTFKAAFPKCSRILFNEILSRTEPNQSLTLGNCIRDIFNSNIVLTNSAETGKLLFVPDTFSAALNPEVTYDSFNSALNNYISEYYSGGEKKRIIKELHQHVNKEKERLSNKLNKLKARVEAGSKDDNYYRYGYLLVNNLHLVKKGMKQIQLSAYENNEEVIVKLDQKLSPQDNAEKYFEKAKDEKKNFNKSKELFSLTGDKFKYYAEISDKISESSELNELIELRKTLKIGVKRKVDQNINDNVNLREYLLDNKYRVWVGKDSKSNDMLSTKIAKQNDYWFHARGYPGSHVVLKVDNPKEGIPKNILNSTASIAAFYSKGKTAKLTPVSYTLRKYVRKKKGMELGKVIITKEKVLLVKPELPKNCESITD